MQLCGDTVYNSTLSPTAAKTFEFAVPAIPAHEKRYVAVTVADLNADNSKLRILP